MIAWASAADSLIMDSWIPKLGANPFLLLNASWAVVVWDCKILHLEFLKPLYLYEFVRADLTKYTKNHKRGGSTL